MDKIAAIGTDGQYLRNKVPGKFLDLIRRPVDGTRSLPMVWDFGRIFKLSFH